MGAIYVHTGGNLFFIRKKLQFHTEETTRLRGGIPCSRYAVCFLFWVLTPIFAGVGGDVRPTAINLYLKLKCK